MHWLTSSANWSHESLIRATLSSSSSSDCSSLLLMTIIGHHDCHQKKAWAGEDKLGVDTLPLAQTTRQVLLSSLLFFFFCLGHDHPSTAACRGLPVLILVSSSSSLSHTACWSAMGKLWWGRLNEKECQLLRACVHDNAASCDSTVRFGNIAKCPSSESIAVIDLLESRCWTLKPLCRTAIRGISAGRQTLSQSCVAFEHIIHTWEYSFSLLFSFFYLPTYGNN